MKYSSNTLKSQLLTLALFFFLMCGSNAYGMSHAVDQESFPPRWLELNYYHKTIMGKYRSDIVNQEFFLHKNGMTNPEAEFQEFKKYVIQYLKDGTHLNEMCRFPTRFSFFQKHFDWMSGAQRPVCANFEKANRPDQVTSISLVLANGYFENPGSYYGHNLLKFNYGNSHLSQESIDASLNYGATATDSPRNPKYIFKGLFGLYDAVYTRNSDFIYTNAYTNLEMRDVWEYELDLTSEEIISLIEHSWEMSFAKFSYYFINDNCAHRISNLVEFIKGADIFEIHGLWLTPIQVTRKLNEFRLVKKVTYHPSLETALFKKYDSASPEDKENFAKFFNQDNQGKKALAEKLNAETLLMALDYLDLKTARTSVNKKDEVNLLKLNAQRAILLNALYSKPAAQVQNDFKVSAPESPAESQPTSAIRLGYGQSEDGGFTTIGYRATNNDLLNIPTSGQEFSQFFMGDFELKKNNGDNEVKISKAVIAEVLRLDSNPLPMTLTKKYSWRLKVDYSERNSLCDDCSTTGIAGQIGTTLRLNDQSLVYLLTGGRLHTREENKNSFLTEITDTGTIIKTSENSVLNLSANLSYNLQDNDADQLYKAEFSYSPKGSFDYRTSIENDSNTSAIKCSIGFYFD